jgi:hypothetical protein
MKQLMILSSEMVAGEDILLKQCTLLRSTQVLKIFIYKHIMSLCLTFSSKLC